MPVLERIDFLLQLDFFSEVPDTAPTRCRFNPECGVAREIIQCDGVVNIADPYAEEA